MFEEGAQGVPGLLVGLFLLLRHLWKYFEILNTKRTNEITQSLKESLQYKPTVC